MNECWRRATAKLPAERLTRAWRDTVGRRVGVPEKWDRARRPSAKQVRAASARRLARHTWERE